MWFNLQEQSRESDRTKCICQTKKKTAFFECVRWRFTEEIVNCIKNFVAVKRWLWRLNTMLSPSLTMINSSSGSTQFTGQMMSNVFLSFWFFFLIFTTIKPNCWTRRWMCFVFFYIWIIFNLKLSSHPIYQHGIRVHAKKCDVVCVFSVCYLQLIIMIMMCNNFRDSNARWFALLWTRAQSLINFA